jgi:hypothetical protein
LLLRRPERDRFFRWAHPTKRPCTLARARCARKEWSRGVSEPGKARQPPQLRRFRQTESPHCKSECNLRGKRSDPSRGANVRSKAGAVPVLTVPTREIRNCRRVRTTSGEMFPAGNVRTRRKDLTRKIQIGNGLNGPAMRPKHPHSFLECWQFLLWRGSMPRQQEKPIRRSIWRSEVVSNASTHYPVLRESAIGSLRVPGL